MLNPEQQSAVDHNEGPMLVLAGAGSGKTRVVTTRIARLLKEGVPGKSIVGLTFTNKAAKEMKERLKGIAGPAARGVTLSTFHSLGARVLREDGHRIGLPGNFTILDQADQVAQVTRVAKDHGIDVREAPAVKLLGRIGWYKNRGLLPGHVVTTGDPIDGAAARIYGAYTEHLRQLGAVDFDDLQLLTRELLKTATDVAKRYQARIRFMLVDEYQDTNPLQLELVRLLAGDYPNLCVVGDDDQAIYGFRGSDVEGILSFSTQFAPCKVVKLEQNYRSTQLILTAANGVIGKNTHRMDKTLFSALGDGEKLRLVTLSDGAEEASWVAKRLAEWTTDGTYEPRDCALLYRAGPQSRPFEEALRLEGVPYVVVGGQTFFERREVKNVLAYLSLMVNPTDEVAFRRVVNLPARGIGDTTIKKLVAGAKKAEQSLLAFTAAGAPGVALKLAQKENLLRFAGPLMDGHYKLREDTEAVGPDPIEAADVCEAAIRRAGLDAAIRRDPDLKSRAKTKDALEEVTDALMLWMDRVRDAEENPDLEESRVIRHSGDALQAFLDRIALDEEERQRERERKKQNDKEGERPNQVTLMSLHASKGLEFPCVFMVGFEDGLLPHRRVLDEGGLDAVAEERRLCYVGITRAQRRLVLTRAASRRRRRQLVPRHVSRFAADIPPEAITEEDLSQPEETFASAAEAFAAFKARNAAAKAARTDPA